MTQVRVVFPARLMAESLANSHSIRSFLGVKVCEATDATRLHFRDDAVNPQLPIGALFYPDDSLSIIYG